MSRDRLILIIGILAVLGSIGGVVIYMSDWKKRALATVGQDTFNTLSALFAAAEKQYALPTDLLARQGWEESDWNVSATNPSGAQGIMQFEPATAAQYGVTNAFDPTQAIPAAAHYMSDLFDEFGKWSLALAAYDAGPGNVTAYGGIPPFAETQSYVSDIIGDVNSEGGPQLT
jgi:soluble lytic murein transglycosylase-like protein